MDATVDRPLERAAIFIDLENIGVMGRSERVRRMLKWILHGLREALPKHKIGLMGPVWGAVRVRLDEHVPIAVHRDALTKLFRGNNGKISWGHEIADLQIIGEIERQLENGTLPNTVVLMTSDGDFAPLVAKLREAKRRVIVVHANAHVSVALEEAADHTISLIELVGKPPLPRRR